MGKLTERIITGYVAGMLGNIPKTIVCRTFNNKGISTLMCSDLVAGVFMPYSKVKKKQGKIFSIIADFLVAGFNGINYMLLLNFTGKKNPILKGWIAGLFNFMLYNGIVTRHGRGKVYSKDLTTNLVMGMNSSIWGISTALIVKQLDKDKEFESRKHNKNNLIEEMSPVQKYPEYPQYYIEKNIKPRF